MDLVEQLDAYYRERGIHPLDFGCASRSDCAAGCDDFTEARASLVGLGYGKPIGLVVVSLDPGRGWPKSSDRTLEAVRERESPERVAGLPRGRHWRETYEIAAAVLSAFGRSLTPEQAVSRFAHVNAAKCTHNLPGSRQAPSRLFRNCRPHMVGELAVLAPDVVVTQGKAAARAIDPLAQIVEEGAGWAIAELEGRPCFWLRLHHPGAWHGAYRLQKKRWPELVERAHNYLTGVP